MVLSHPPAPKHLLVCIPSFCAGIPLKAGLEEGMLGMAASQHRQHTCVYWAPNLASKGLGSLAPKLSLALPGYHIPSLVAVGLDLKTHIGGGRSLCPVKASSGSYPPPTLISDASGKVDPTILSICWYLPALSSCYVPRAFPTTFPGLKGPLPSLSQALSCRASIHLVRLLGHCGQEVLEAPYRCWIRGST
ncbi:hypothetical protein DSO57_1027007 [Entomophthora muscae]|uniref:Uncharacterized protein n=1 Tax=Entomophthora muscae TaxID=34485 RepID=A0ACC2SER4_9FUNG|nr:hypothetical protein DSO57_1027007 [Entomophthora muscae]